MILLTYNLRRDEAHLQRLLSSLVSTDEIVLVVLDFRPNKSQPNYVSSDKIDVKYIPVEIEDSNKAFEITYNIAQNNNCTFYGNIEENVSFNGSLDKFYLDCRDDNNIGAIYSDLLVEASDQFKTMIPVLNTMFPPKSDNVPFILFRKLPPQVAEEAAKANINYFIMVAKLFIVKHIPETCIIVHNE